MERLCITALRRAPPPNLTQIKFISSIREHNICKHDLIQSLAQLKSIYLFSQSDGTTDTTRTVHFTTPTDEEKDAYTRVLLGNLDIQRVQWPASSRIGGSDLDALARRYLWAAGLDFGHGTGHGVGHFLNVHEGPHGISKYRSEPLLEGMVVTDGNDIL